MAEDGVPIWGKVQKHPLPLTLLNLRSKVWSRDLCGSQNHNENECATTQKPAGGHRNACIWRWYVLPLDLVAGRSCIATMRRPIQPL